MDQIKEAEEEVSRIVPPEPGAPFNQVEHTIYARRSVRYYRKKQVPEYLIRRILEAGRFAPSAGNGQPWKFIVIQDQNMIEEMSEDIIDNCKEAKKKLDYFSPPPRKFRGWVVRYLQKKKPSMLHPIPLGGITLVADRRAGTFHGAPTVIVILADMRAPGNPVLDIGIAGQTIVLAAHSLGLGTCWMGFITSLKDNKKWIERFGIRFPYELITAIAVGFPRGIPDGYVERETQVIDWFAADGSFKTMC